jgi:dynein heavy chain
VERGALVSSIKLQCEKFKLQPALITIEKTLQLFDTLQVRHGLMLVGPAGGGKTSSYRILASCLSSMAEYYKVSCYSINPKSIEMGQLYGQYNEQTHEVHILLIVVV